MFYDNSKISQRGKALAVIRVIYVHAYEKKNLIVVDKLFSSKKKKKAYAYFLH